MAPDYQIPCIAKVLLLDVADGEHVPVGSGGHDAPVRRLDRK